MLHNANIYGVSTQLITSVLVAHENSAFKKNDSACLI